MTFINLNLWDWLFIIGVSAQATILACLSEPKAKAFIILIPIPFVMACLALNRFIDASHVLGLIFLFFYTTLVRILNHQLRFPIIVSIIISATIYCLISGLCIAYVPMTNLLFWSACAGVLVIGVVARILLRHRDEPAYRTPLPIWLKLPIILVIVFCLVAIKKTLGGFMAMFPMVGVIASYEARHQLWTINDAISRLMLMMLPVLVFIYLAQTLIGFVPSMLTGFGIFLLILCIGMSSSKRILGVTLRHQHKSTIPIIQGTTHE